ncbi:MAG: hypothetical protein ACRDGB_14520 [Candidatus Limnocylindria bacterium]
MAKESGLSAAISIDDSSGTLRIISNDVLSFNVGTPQGLIDVTGVDKSAMERIIGLSDGTFSCVCAFNDTLGASSFDVFKTRTGVRTVTWGQSGQTLSMEMLIGTVTYPRAADGSLQINADLSLADGTVPTWS